MSDLFAPVVGGLEGHVESLGASLASRGHEVSVVTQRLPGVADREQRDALDVRRIDGLSRLLAGRYVDASYRFHPPAPDPGQLLALARLLRELKPDVVHMHAWMAYSLLPLRRATDAAFVMTLHDYGLVCAKKTLVRDGARCPGPSRACLGCASRHYGRARGVALVGMLRASRVLHAGFDRLIAVSGRVREASFAGARGVPIDVIPNFLPDDLAERGRAEARPGFLPAADGYLLYAGALAAHKGVDVLVRAHARLVDAPPLVLIGRAELPLTSSDRVVVVPATERTQVMRAFQSCAVGCVPSTWDEPCPSVALEAMTAGAPVVASNVGGLPDLVPDGVAGLLVPPGDEIALAGALERVLADGRLHAALARGARSRALAYTASAVVPRIEQAYAEARR